MNVLVTVAKYSDKSFVHARNKYYIDNGLRVEVLDFSIKEDVIIDGVNTISLSSYKKSKKEYEVLICHAANIRNHFFFLLKYGSKFQRFIFFFHGHEVLRCKEVYPKPYPFFKNNYVSNIIQDLYDTLKLFIWRKYYSKIAYKSYFVFVSKWMLNEFLKWTKIPFDTIKDKYMITYNCVSREFEINCYDYNCVKDYDFITIRGNIDGPKYCIDLINEIAKNNLDKKFLLIGKGRLFNHIPKADNITWINEVYTHEKIVEVLQKSRCALMPTRTDAQGVMMCEMATFGMPVITSDLEVCKEALGEFENVRFIKPETADSKIVELMDELEKRLPYNKNLKYYNFNTSGKELELILSILKR